MYIFLKIAGTRRRVTVPKKRETESEPVLIGSSFLKPEPEPLTSVPVPEPAVPRRFRFQKRVPASDAHPYL